jgi:gliding motility-associated-like protein
MKKILFFFVCILSFCTTYSQCDSTQIVNEYCKCKTYLAEVFTPNYDGLNEDFGFYSNCELSEIYSLKIFNRWGKLIFESENHNEKWNGHYMNTPCAAGLYSYVISLKFKYEDNQRLISRKVNLKN